MEASIEQTRVAKRLVTTDGADCGPTPHPGQCACGSRVMRYFSDFTGEQETMCLASQAKLDRDDQ